VEGTKVVPGAQKVVGRGCGKSRLLCINAHKCMETVVKTSDLPQRVLG